MSALQHSELFGYKLFWSSSAFLFVNKHILKAFYLIPRQHVSSGRKDSCLLGTEKILTLLLVASYVLKTSKSE